MQVKPTRNNQSSCLALLSQELADFPTKPENVCSNASVTAHLFIFLMRISAMQNEEHVKRITAVRSTMKGAARLDSLNGLGGAGFVKDSVTEVFKR